MGNRENIAACWNDDACVGAVVPGRPDRPLRSLCVGQRLQERPRSSSHFVNEFMSRGNLWPPGCRAGCHADAPAVGKLRHRESEKATARRMAV